MNPDQSLRITYVTAGAGGMYCGACLRDSLLVRGLIARGHEVQFVPLYTPLKTDSCPLPETTPVFFGGINAYAQQHASFFRRPRPWLDKLLDHPAVLQWAAGFAISAKPEDLGDMTLSILAGPAGRQAREVGKLLDFLRRQPRPDVVVLANSLLSGLVLPLRDQLQAPVVCTLQGEDGFLAGMSDRHHDNAIVLIQRNCAAVARFTAPSDAYRQRMAGLLRVDADRIDVVHSGIPMPPEPPRQPATPPVIGYLSRIGREKGVDLLIEAVARLAADGAETRVEIAGKLVDKAYWREVEETLRRGGLGDRCRYLGELDHAGKHELFSRCTLFVCPSRLHESKGMVVLEAMAAGVPVVAPDRGMFPELLDRIDGGRLFASEDPESLATVLKELLGDPDGCAAMGVRARKGIAAHHSVEQMVEAMDRVCRAAKAQPDIQSLTP